MENEWRMSEMSDDEWRMSEMSELSEMSDE